MILHLPMPWLRHYRLLLPAATALILAGCGMLKGPLGDDDEAVESKTQQKRPETPSLLGPGKERVKSGSFPVIHFDGDNWKIPASEQAKVASVARWFAGHSERVLISSGAQSLSPEYSRQLSDLRAQTVRKALITAGVPETKILTVSFGEDAPESTGGGVAFSIVTTGE
jgi:outer membrane protein OmpA-like peptidoglycan-associated protein